MTEQKRYDDASWETKQSTLSLSPRIRKYFSQYAAFLLGDLWQHRRSTVKVYDQKRDAFVWVVETPNPFWYRTLYQRYAFKRKPLQKLRNLSKSRGRKHSHIHYRSRRRLLSSVIERRRTLAALERIANGKDRQQPRLKGSFFDTILRGVIYDHLTEGYDSSAKGYGSWESFVPPENRVRRAFSLEDVFSGYQKNKSLLQTTP